MSDAADEPEIVVGERIDYAEFGERFIARAVTKDRIEAGLADLAGKGIKIGPFGIGPLNMASVVAEGKVGTPRITRIEPNVAYDVTIPVSMSVLVTLGGQKLRLEAGIEIDLELHARVADPLLIVIEIPRITERDVRLVVRAEAIGSAFDWIIEPIGKVVRAEVAARVNAMVNEPDSVRSRVFDIAARIDDDPSDQPIDVNFSWISYAEFGHNFFEHAITQARIEEGTADIGGRPIDIGPMKAGPRDIATVTAKGTVGTPVVAARKGDLIAFDLNIPVSLDLLVEVGGDNRYAADITIPIVLTANAGDPLLIVVDIDAPEADQIELNLDAKSTKASLLGFLGGVKAQVREQVADVVRGEVGDPPVRIVDVGERIDSA